MTGSKSSIFRFADIEVREREFSLVKAGEALPVEPKAFRVLLILLRNSQKLLAKDELLTAVWGDTAVSENSLARSIALLRRLLGDEARDPRFIETVATVGYRWVSKVEVSEETTSEAEPPPEPPEWRIHRKKAGNGNRIWPLALGGACVLAAGAAAAWYMHRPLPPAAHHRVHPAHLRRPRKRCSRNRWEQAVLQSGRRHLADRRLRRIERTNPDRSTERRFDAHGHLA